MNHLKHIIFIILYAVVISCHSQTTPTTSESTHNETAVSPEANKNETKSEGVKASEEKVSDVPNTSNLGVSTNVETKIPSTSKESSCGELYMHLKTLIYITDTKGDYVPLKEYALPKKTRRLSNRKAISVTFCRAKIHNGLIEQLGLSFFSGEEEYSKTIKLDKPIKLADISITKVSTMIDGIEVIFGLGDLLSFKDHLEDCTYSGTIELSYKVSSIILK